MENEDTIHDPEIAQPLCTALQIALVELLRTFNITPRAVIGHPSGEIAAAHTIGAVDQATACKIAYYRGQVAKKVRDASKSHPGVMISVKMTVNVSLDTLTFLMLL